MSGRNWTPYHIEIILHHHSSLGEFPRSAAPAYPATVGSLISAGVLELRDAMYRTTNLGDALVEMWLQTPMPRAVCIDPRTGREVHREADAYAEGAGTIGGRVLFDPKVTEPKDKGE